MSSYSTLRTPTQPVKTIYNATPFKWWNRWTPNGSGTKAPTRTPSRHDSH